MTSATAANDNDDHSNATITNQRRLDHYVTRGGRGGYDDASECAKLELSRASRDLAGKLERSELLGQPSTRSCYKCASLFALPSNRYRESCTGSQNHRGPKCMLHRIPLTRLPSCKLTGSERLVASKTRPGRLIMVEESWSWREE